MTLLAAAALAIVLAAAAWLVLVGAVCAARPDLALAQLGRMGGGLAIQIGEHALRGAAGAALILRADHSKVPEIFTIGGWFVLLSSLTILILPRTWHHAYARYWAQKLPPIAVRIMAIPTFAGAGWLAYAAL